MQTHNINRQVTIQGKGGIKTIIKQGLLKKMEDKMYKKTNCTVSYKTNKETGRPENNKQNA